MDIQRIKDQLNFNKLKDGIYGVAVGDALGVPVEFSKRSDLEYSPVTDFISNGVHHQPAGTWSDDTSMTLATLDAIVSDDALPVSLKNIKPYAEKYAEWLNTGKYAIDNIVFDAGYTCRMAIGKYNSGTPLNKCGMDNPQKSNGNGSLMHMLPIAFLLRNESSIKKRMDYTFAVSSITHSHIRSCMACHIYVEYLIRLLNGQDKVTAYEECMDEMLEYYEKWFASIPNMVMCKTKGIDSEEELAEFDRLFCKNIHLLQKNEISSSGYVVDTLEASIWSLLNSTSYMEAVYRAVNLGDDTDTIGSITGGMAGIVYGYDNIPANLISRLRGKSIIEKILNKIN